MSAPPEKPADDAQVCLARAEYQIHAGDSAAAAAWALIAVARELASIRRDLRKRR
ncbi:hypothetical protein [Streptomyces erythrochromogenes]|uniref:hypothetical protein n=1 Tax=Streptomyces erythrochromogenes TaxID=285574 RepID=UPI00343263A9